MRSAWLLPWLVERMSEQSIAPRVSFVIPVKNDADRLRRCLHTIAANAYPRSAVEVIVADNGSTDASPAVAVEAGAIVQHAPGYRVAELRNRAAAAASGTIIAFVDSDHEISPRLDCQAAVDALQDPRVGAVGALCRPPAERHLGTADVRRAARTHRGPVGRRMAGRREHGGEPRGVPVGGRLRRVAGNLRRCRSLSAAARARLARASATSASTTSTWAIRRRSGVCSERERWRGRDNLRVTFRPGWTWRELPSALVPIGEAALLADGPARLALVDLVWAHAAW